MKELHNTCGTNQNKNYDNYDMSDICDLDNNKICDNCGKCLGIDSLDYREVMIDGVVDNGLEVDEYILSEDTLDSNLEDYDPNVEFIEDIPEVKKEYEHKLSEIFKELENPKSLHEHDHHHNHSDCNCKDHNH